MTPLGTGVYTMGDPQYTHADFAYKVLESEGLGYAVLHYFGRDISRDVDDYALAAVWEQAYDALRFIEQTLTRWRGESDD